MNIAVPIPLIVAEHISAIPLKKAISRLAQTFDRKVLVSIDDLLRFENDSDDEESGVLLLRPTSEYYYLPWRYLRQAGDGMFPNSNHAHSLLHIDYNAGVTTCPILHMPARMPLYLSKTAFEKLLTSCWQGAPLSRASTSPMNVSFTAVRGERAVTWLSRQEVELFIRQWAGTEAALWEELVRLAGKWEPDYIRQEVKKAGILSRK